MWYQNAFRRIVVDMHIPDWDERFLSKFDSHNFVRLLKAARAQSIVLYAQSHVGVFNYPTQVGEMHRGLKGKDLFGEMVDLCHQNDIAVVAYTSIIFDLWASNHDPDWRIKLMDGRDADEAMRFGLCCPNSPYRDYAASWAEELLTHYQVEGIRFDMTFWPAICYCHHCRERFQRETGNALPETIDWDNPLWVAFQRKREEWLADFASLMTNTARRARPGVSVEHQASTYNWDWKMGVTDKMVPSNDFLQGDFYGDALQGSFVRKLLYNLSPNLPYGFETSAAVTLNYHSNLKPVELLYAKACAAVAGQGAMIYIYDIDPVGTLNERVFNRVGSVLDKTMVYDPYRGGELAQDVAVYFSMHSKYNPTDNGKSPLDPNLAGKSPHIEAALNACSTLITHHIPFGVVTHRDLDRLDRHKILVLPDVMMMDSQEVEAVRRYVANGGNLYVSKGASLVSEFGIRHPDFLLADVFGVNYQRMTVGNHTYLAPETGFENLMPEFDQIYPLELDQSQAIVQVDGDAQVLAKIVLPYTDPADIHHFSSIHCNPPGIPTDYPALVWHSYGKGKVLYSSSSLEGEPFPGQVFINLLAHFEQPFTFQADAPSSVEVTLFDQPLNHRKIINLLNFQKDLPNIPIDGIRVRVRLTDATPLALTLLPGNTSIDYSFQEGIIEFTAPRLETFAMFSLRYQV